MSSTQALKVMMKSGTTDQPKITRKPDHSGYETPLGLMPPVTTVLSATSSPESKAALEAWKKRTPVEYQKLGAMRGTWVHSACEHYHETGEWKTHLAHGGYLESMKPWVEENVVEPVLMEAPIYHPLGFSGTFDLLTFCSEWPELTLLDYKTSKRSKLANPTYLHGYLAQLGAYSLGLQYTYDIRPDKGVLCIGRPTGSAEIVTIEADELRQQEKNFLRRLDLFHEQLSQAAMAA
jgi:hypothetical protein